GRPWSSSSSGIDGFAIRGALEHELVTADAAADRRKPLEDEPAVAEEVEDFSRRRNLERVAADPVEQIVPPAHSAVATPPPAAQVRASVAAGDCAGDDPQLEWQHRRDRVRSTACHIAPVWWSTPHAY